MSLFHNLFITLLLLLVIIALAAILPEVQNATGVPHPEYKGMFISPTNIDADMNTRSLGFFFGSGIIAVFGLMLMIGNRKNGKVTPIKKWLIIGMLTYYAVFIGLTMSHTRYTIFDGGPFFMSMPVPTAWMIFGAWFTPLIITIAYVWTFERNIISQEEIEEFHQYLKEEHQIDVSGDL